MELDRSEWWFPPEANEREVNQLARTLMADYFLEHVLIPKIGEGAINNSSEVKRLYDDFRTQNPGLGEDFDIAHSWRVAKLRADISAHMIEVGTLIPEDPDMINNEIAEVLLGKVAFGEQYPDIP